MDESSPGIGSQSPCCASVLRCYVMAFRDELILRHFTTAIGDCVEAIT